jgi:hypothetical protein
LQEEHRLSSVPAFCRNRAPGDEILNHGQDRNTKLRLSNASPSASGSTAALLRFYSLLLCLFVLFFNVQVGLAQVLPSEPSEPWPWEREHPARLFTSLEEAGKDARAPRATDEAAPRFRVERTTVAGGGELLTIWGRVVDESEPPAFAHRQSASADLPRTATPIRTEEIPLVSVLRDTLGDARPENDVLREVWVHAYARPKLAQQAAALVPFLYKGLRVEPRASSQGPPRAIINLSDTEQPVWRRLFVAGVTNVLVDQPLLKTSVHNYQRNIRDYRHSNLMRALTILSLYSSQPELDSPFSEAELIQMQSQLALTDKTFGGLVDRVHFPSFHEKETAALRDTRGHNWELLRQQAEASGLYFEPLSLSDKAVTHALIWFPADSLTGKNAAAEQAFQGRFLNIKNPWRDERLRRWQGYTETKYFNSENQLVSAGDANASYKRSVRMIPLALYGLDFQKIPALLIDFRNPANPRRREMSGRLINDITRDVLSISKFGNVYYLVGRSIFDFVISKRGIDFNQPSRLRSAAELRLLLSFNPDLSNGLREQLNQGLDNLSVNPLENGSKAERELAFTQYQALHDYAVREDGLAAQLERERSVEAAKFAHRGLDGKLLRLANVVTFGRYTHREKLTPELRQQLDKERQLAYHINFLRQVARTTPVVEVSWTMDEILPSLRYLAENGSEKDQAAAKAVGSIFSRTDDVAAKELCLTAMKRIGNKTAQKELLRIYNDETVAAEWRLACAEYLQIARPQRSKTAETEMTAGAKSLSRRDQ